MNNLIRGLFTELDTQIKTLLKSLNEKSETGIAKLETFKEETIQSLKSLEEEINDYVSQDDFEIEEFAFYHLLKYNPFYEEFQNLEQFRYQPIMRFNSSDNRLNQLIERVYKEINPIHSPPLLTTLSNTDQYYWAYPEYGIIALPLGEEHNLINLPDLYHEIAHFIYETYSEFIFEQINNLVQRHFQEEIDRVHEEGRAEHLVDDFEEFSKRWQESWIEEFVCDIIATLLVGKAYAWTNFKITSLSSGSDEVYESNEEHPSDESRMRVILATLKTLDPDIDTNDIETDWRKFKDIINNPIPENYNLIFPDSLLSNIVHDVLTLLRGTSLNSFIDQEKLFEKPIISYLNEAWDVLLENPNDFMTWRDNAINEIYK